MEITVDRTISPEGNLVFTITAKDPHFSQFGDVEKKMMESLDLCKKSIEEITTEENKLQADIFSLIHRAKEKAFYDVIENLKFAIKNQLKPRFNHVCKEIYNWIYDYQTGYVKTWLQEFDPIRTKYYFDNDRKNQNLFKSSGIPDDKIDEDDDEDDEF